jgi:peptidoglycan/xylan/chitin deacetylase (PgdA/CDA1 family)
MLRMLFTTFSPSGSRARLTILIFHRVLPEPDPLLPDEPCQRRFHQVMSWISQWFNMLPLEDAIALLKSDQLPERAAAITFDDGYADNLIHATPILKRHGLHATFFIATGFLDGGIMWNDQIIEAVRKSTAPAIDGAFLCLGWLPLQTLPEKRAALARLIPAIKHLLPDERTRMVGHIVDACHVELPRDLMLTSKQLLALRSSGMGIGAHTVSHPILARLDSDAARREISDGRNYLEKLLGERVALFAYPNGKFGADYNEEHVHMVKSQGFSAALSTNWGTAGSKSDIFQLPRFTPWDRARNRYGLRLLTNLWSKNS